MRQEKGMTSSENMKTSQPLGQDGGQGSRLLGNQAENTQKDPDEDQEFLDGGYGWLIVAGSFCGRAITTMSLCFGLLLIVFHDYFGKSTAETAFVGSSYFISVILAGPLASSFSNQIGHRATCMFGSLICCLGYILSAFATSLIHLCLTYGLLVGFGECMVYVTSTVMPNFYFKKRLKLAMGFVVTGTGVGVLVTPIILQYSIDYYTWRGAMFIAAGISLQGCVCGALFRPNNKSQRKGKEEKLKALAGLKEMFLILKQVKPLLFTIASYLLCFSFSFYYNFFPSRATDYGYTADQAAVLLSIGGFCSTAARMLLALAITPTKPNLSILYGLVILLQSASHFILLFRDPPYGVVALSSAIFGASVGMLALLYPLRLAELYGARHMTNAIGWFLLLEGSGDIVAPPIGGSMVDATGSSMVCFIMSGLMTVLSGVMNLPLSSSKLEENPGTKQSENVDTEPPERQDTDVL